MKKYLLLISALLVSYSISAQTEVNVEWFTPTIVHISKPLHTNQNTPDKSEVVIATPQSVKIKKSEKNGVETYSSGELIVTIDKKTHSVTFSTPKGEVLTMEKGCKQNQTQSSAGYAITSASQSWSLDTEEAIYGLGILQNGKMSQRGENRELCPNNTEDGMPFFQSVKGYGIYWDNYSKTMVKDEDNTISFEAEVADKIDYYFIYGVDADGVVAGMRHLTGDVPMFPLWTYGFHQSKERYKTQKETCGVLDKYRELQIPIDGIIQDWQYWGNNYLWNAMEFLNEDFSRPEDMIRHIHEQNAHISISIWQSFGPQTKAYRQLDEKGLLFNIETWPQSGISHIWPPRMDYPSGVLVYDAYSKEARDIYWENLKRLYDLDLDAWWMDSTEPDHFNHKQSDFEHMTGMGRFRNVRCIFPLMCVGGVYDHQRAEPNGSEKRLFILTRSGFIGQQRYGCNVWSGDVVSTWDMLRKQIPAGLNFCLTGNPNFNADLGGFFAGSYNGSWDGLPGYKNPAYHELYVRWMQQGVFTPMMRSHGADVPREIFLYGKKGEPVYDALVGAVKLRYMLLPYIYSTAWQVTKNRSTMMRALVMDYRSDSNVHNMNNEYMFGQAILATPILNAHYTPEVIRHDNDANAGWDSNTGKTKMQTSDVDFTKSSENEFYLPKGNKWYYFNSNEIYDGGQTVKRTTPLGEIPFFVKAGSILPIGPDVQYSTEKSWDNLEIRVYPGADASFTLYEDEFDNYNYESGKYSEIPFIWNDKSRTLTINARQGSYNGMIMTRTFNIVMPDGTTKSVNYQGKKVTVKL
ncbi:MAG: DUF5110 domain-containing protein [Marinilabiliaceae bacterium]|nr:DUF5110 domain-containing protein [Marinilabiliaceae bacterium]